MSKPFESTKLSFIINLVIFAAIGFAYPALSFRGGIPHILSLAIFGICILFFGIKSFVSKRIVIGMPSICILFFIIETILSTAINKASTLTTSVLLCSMLILFASIYFARKDGAFKSFALGFSIGILAFTAYLFLVSNFQIKHLNTEYFVNVNRICNAYSVSLILLVIYVFTTKPNIQGYIIAFILIIFFGYLLILLGSRSAFFVAVIAFLLNLFFKFWKKHKAVLIFGTLFSILLALIVIISVPQIRNAFSRYLDFLSFIGGNSNADYSTRERFNMQVTALYHFLESPIFGHGINGYKLNGPYNVYSHNNITDVLCNFGIVGFLLYEIPLIYSVCICFKAKDKKDKAILMTLIIYFVITQMTGVLFEDKLNSLIYGFVIGKSISISPSAQLFYSNVNADFERMNNGEQIEENQNNQVINKANKSFKWSTITEILAKIVVPISNMILSRIIAPEIFGIVASISVVTGLADVFADGGFSYLILHKKIDDAVERKKFEGTITLINIIVSSFLTALIIVFRNPLSSFVGADGYGIYMLIAAIQIPFYGFSTIQLSICKREFSYNKILIVRLLSLFIQISSTIVLAFLGKGIEALVLRGVIGAVSQAVLTPIICKAKPTFGFSKKHFSGIWKLALFYLIDALIIWASSSVDTIMINQFFNQTIVGVFKNSITMENSIITLLTAIYYPILIALLAQNKEKDLLEKHLFDYQKVLSTILIPLGVGMFLYRDFLSLILFGSGWPGASWVIGILGLANIIKTATGGFAIIVFYATGKPLYAMISNLVGVALKVIMYLLFGNLGFVPLLISLVFPFAIIALIAIIIAKKKYGIPILPYFKNILVPLLLCVPMALIGVLQQLSLPGNIGNIIGVILCALMYFLLVYFVDKKRFKNVFNVLTGNSLVQTGGI